MPSIKITDEFSYFKHGEIKSFHLKARSEPYRNIPRHVCEIAITEGKGEYPSKLKKKK